MNKVYTKN